jgi:medium-chain acyl-[acyl-carrier-protein] hydrolase
MTGPSLTAHDLRSRLAHLPPERRAQLLQRLRGGRSKPAGPGWFVHSGNSEAALRLFCFSYAGGGSTIFRSWNDRLAGQVEVCAVQLPGRESRATEPAYRRLSSLIDDLYGAIEPLLDDKPFALFGHSMGALVAFELARRLRRSGAPQPEQLLLSAFRAPQLPNPNIRIFHLPDEVLKTVLAKDGTPQEVLQNDELMKALLPTLRADLEVCETYEYVAEAPLPVPMAVFGGFHDVRVGRADLEQWSAQAGAGFDLTMLPGSHFFIHSAQDLLLAQLSTRLEALTVSKGDDEL